MGRTCAGKEIHWIEWGVGGGAGQNGDIPATTALEAARYPFWGIWGPYNVSRDPWQVPDVRDYMHHYVNMTSQYLLQVGAVCACACQPACLPCLAGWLRANAW